MRFTPKKIALDILLVIEAVAFCFLINWQFRGNVLNSAHVKQNSTATVFIPGFGGNAVSTNDFINQFSQHRLASRALRVYVPENNRISTMHQYHPIAKNNPMVQLEFQDDLHPQKQAGQMIYVMHYLYQKYHIKKVNFIGHSSGGNIAFDYMIHHPHATNVPQPEKFVTIGANYAPHDPLVKNLPKSLHVLNIAGEIYNAKSDGEVPNKIVQPMGKLVRKHVGKYRYFVYRSNPVNAEHSMLHENPKLDKIIGEFLWNNHYPSGSVK